jgi:hypothetical protein
MKKYGIILAILAVALVFGLVFVGCESAVSEPKTVGVQTYLNTGGDAFVEYNGNLTVKIDHPNGRIYAGQIVNGKLTLELPPSVATSDDLSNLTVNPPGTTSFTAWGFFLEDENGATFGSLQYRYDIWGGNTDIEERLNQFFIVYYSNDCTVSGTYFGDWNGVTVTYEYRIVAKQGWNYIYNKGERTSPTTFHRILISDISSAPKEMKWSITPW